MLVACQESSISRRSSLRCAVWHPCRLTGMRTRTGQSAAMGNYTAGWVTGSRRVKTCEAGTCSKCGARLSVYRPKGEPHCAPCLAAISTSPSTLTRFFGGVSV
jgi:hypothetical protein